MTTRVKTKHPHGGDEPAFPMQFLEGGSDGEMQASECQEGMTKRELIAALILSGMATRSGTTAETIEEAVSAADGLLNILAISHRK